MNPTKQNPAALAAQWQRHITVWQTSGLSQAAYCKKHKLIYHRFGYWFRKLKGGVIEDKKESGFARVVQHSRTESNGLSLRLPNGVELRGVDANNLPVVNQLLRQWS